MIQCGCLKRLGNVRSAECEWTMPYTVNPKSCDWGGLTVPCGSLRGLALMLLLTRVQYIKNW